MVTLPAYNSGVQADIGSAKSAADDTTIERAAAGVGNSLINAGLSIAATDNAVLERQRRESEKTLTINAGLTEQYALQKHATDAEKILSQTPPTGEKLVENMNALWDQTRDAILSETPPERQAEALLRVETMRTQEVKRYAGQAHQMREQSLDGVLKGRRQLVMDMVTGGADVATVKELSESYVRELAPALGEARTAMIRQRFGEAVEIASFQKFAKENPVIADRMIRERVAGTVTSASNNPNVSAVIEASQRHGIDPVMALAIVRTESNFDPKARASKTIHGLFQLTAKETQRVLGIDFASDPAMQAEAGVLVLKNNMRDLQMNGLDVNHYNMKGAHWLGLGGWKMAQGVTPDMSFRDFYGPMMERAGHNVDKVWKENNFDKFPTVGSFLSHVRKITDSAAGEVSKYVGARTEPTRDPVVINGHTYQYLTPELISQFGAATRADVDKLSENMMKDLTKKRVENREQLNAYNESDRKALNDLAQAEDWGGQLMSGDSTAVQRVLQHAQTHWFISKSDSAALEKMMNSTDPAVRIRAYELAMTVQASDPEAALRHSGFEARSIKDIQDYSSIRLIEGLDAAEIVRRIDRMNDPNVKTRTEEVKQRIREGKTEITESALADIRSPDGTRVDDRWFKSFRSADPKLVANAELEKMRDFMTQKLRDQYAFHMASAGSAGDDAHRTALARAKADVGRMIGQTSVSGKPELTIAPIEKFVRASAEDIATQAVIAVRSKVQSDKTRGDNSVASLADIKRDGIRLMPTQTTFDDIRIGRSPRYQLYYRDSEGRWDVAGTWAYDGAATASGPRSGAQGQATGSTVQSARNKAAAGTTTPNGSPLP